MLSRFSNFRRRGHLKRIFVTGEMRCCSGVDHLGDKCVPLDPQIVFASLIRLTEEEILVLCLPLS